MKKKAGLVCVLLGSLLTTAAAAYGQLSGAVQLARQVAGQTTTASTTAVNHAAGATPAKTVKHISFAAWALVQTNTILIRLNEEGDFVTAKTELNNLCDQAIAFAPAGQTRILRRVDFARLLVTQLAMVSGAKTRLSLLTYLRANHALAQTLVFLVKQQKAAIPQIYAMLDHLRKTVGIKAAQYPNLTAAICSILYTPLTSYINENQGHSPDPVQLFNFYVDHQRQMYFGIRDVPAELLIYMVDTTSSIHDLRWALAHYHGNPAVGSLFFSIRYDYGFLHGQKLQIDSAGFTLPNIKQFGGVCADQAYFASEVAKAIGVPSAYDTAMGNDAGHAWVGFLQARGDHGWWNFLTGRYQEYRGIQGHVMNPQTRQAEPDTFISLSAQLIHTSARQRWNAAALTDAAGRMMLLEKQNHPFNPAPLPADVDQQRPSPRRVAPKQILTLLRRAVNQCNGYAAAWFDVSQLAAEGKLTYAQKSDWSSELIRICGRRYPDFAMAVLTPMILTVQNVHEQNGLWNKVFTLFESSRFDLAGDVRMYQAAMWKKAGHLNRAGECYMDVINRFASAGPFIMGALNGAQDILQSQGHKNRVLKLWETSWLKIKPPSRELGIFMKESDWYRVGTILKQKLNAAGLNNLADKVQNQLDLVLSGKVASN